MVAALIHDTEENAGRRKMLDGRFGARNFQLNLRNFTCHLARLA